MAERSPSRLPFQMNRFLQLQPVHGNSDDNSTLEDPTLPVGHMDIYSSHRPFGSPAAHPDIDASPIPHISTYLHRANRSEVDLASSDSIVTSVAAEHANYSPDDDFTTHPTASDGSVTTMTTLPSSRSSTSIPGADNLRSAIEQVVLAMAATAPPTAMTDRSTLERYRLDPDSVHAINGEQSISNDGWMTQICIHMPGDPDGQLANKCKAIIDCGSPFCLTWHKVLKEIGYDFLIRRMEHSIALRSMNGHPLEHIGQIDLRWNVSTKDATYMTTFIVLEDPDDRDPSFDFLLGRNWIQPTRALMPNPAVLSDIYFVGC